jgi:hypothetical protein
MLANFVCKIYIVRMNIGLKGFHFKHELYVCVVVAMDKNHGVGGARP